MATRKIVPRADNEGGIGTAVKRWASGFFTSLVVGNTTFPEGGLPKFSAHKNGTNQTGIVTGTYTKVTFPTEVYDVGNAYNAGNSKWIPGIVGEAHISAYIYWAGASDTSYLSVSIYKNGVIYKRFYARAPGLSDQGVSIDCDVLIDSITDYFEIYAAQGSGVNQDIYGAETGNWFMGHMIP